MGGVPGPDQALSARYCLATRVSPKPAAGTRNRRKTLARAQDNGFTAKLLQSDFAVFAEHALQ
jgi:hypothetical protein